MPVIADLVDSRGWMELTMGTESDPEVRGEKLVTESSVTGLVLAEVRASQGGWVAVAVEVGVRLDVTAVLCAFVLSVLGFSVMVRLVRLEELRVKAVLMSSDLEERWRAWELPLETLDNIPALAPFWLEFYKWKNK